MTVSPDTNDPAEGLSSIYCPRRLVGSVAAAAVIVKFASLWSHDELSCLVDAQRSIVGLVSDGPERAEVISDGECGCNRDYQ
jgi:hypothetical protein